MIRKLVFKDGEIMSDECLGCSQERVNGENGKVFGIE